MKSSKAFAYSSRASVCLPRSPIFTVSYTLPKEISKKLNLSNARVYAAGANLLTFSGLHIDPELPSDGYYNFGMPAMRTVTLCL